jgi:membrane associated rhomboid family serine protease
MQSLDAIMTVPVADPLESILKMCAATAPKPWYPKLFCQENGVLRDSLDPPLERLRLGGLIQLTEWMEGAGQGYALTPAGRRALESPRDLDRLRGDKPIIPNGAVRPVSRLREGDPTTYDRGEAVREALINEITPYVTYTLLTANVVWFFYGLQVAQAQGIRAGDFIAGSDIGILRKIGAIDGSYLVSGDWRQWGRLLSCCFVHGSIWHLGMNMLGLYWVGPLVERMWGSLRFGVIYMIAGLGGSCAMVITGPQNVGAGASGAIWGMMTALAAWIILNRGSLPPPLVSAWLRQLLFLLVLNVAIGFVPNVSMAGHLGGGAVGAIAAILLHYQRFGKGMWRWLGIIALVVLPIVCVGTVAQASRVDKRWNALFGEKERQEMNEQLLPAARKVEQNTEAAYLGQVKAVWMKHSTRRTPEEVNQALTKMDEMRTDLTEVANRFRAAGPYRSTRIEDARQTQVQLLEAWTKLLDLSERSLKENEDKEGDLVHQEEQLSELKDQWRRLVN